MARAWGRGCGATAVGVGLLLGEVKHSGISDDGCTTCEYTQNH